MMQQHEQQELWTPESDHNSTEMNMARAYLRLELLPNYMGKGRDLENLKWINDRRLGVRFDSPHLARSDAEMMNRRTWELFEAMSQASNMHSRVLTEQLESRNPVENRYGKFWTAFPAIVRNPNIAGSFLTHIATEGGFEHKDHPVRDLRVCT